MRVSGESAWAAAELNQPIFSGEALRTDLRARGEIRIGANTIELSHGSGLEIVTLRDGVTQIRLSHGRIGLLLRQADENESVEIDVPGGGVWLLEPGNYDIDVGEGNRPVRVAAFDGTAQFAGGGGDKRIESGQVAVISASQPAAATIETATADDFVAWCRDRNYDDTQFDTPYYISRYVTGYDELASVGVWKVNEDYGPVWFPTKSAEWAPYRFGHWSWVAPWGWTWIDDRPWGFAPSHYGRWAMIDDHWAWVPGNYTSRPLYAPAVVAFLGTPGVGLSSEEGATVAWFPLAPGEAYWPSYTRDLDYVRDLNFASVKDVAVIGMQADGEPPREMFNENFANRPYATVVPRSVFTNGRPVGSARVSLPEKRLQNAPVLMASPQISPASTERIARSAPASPLLMRARLQLPRKGGPKPRRIASAQSLDRGQQVNLRGAHLHVPSYAGQLRSRQMIPLRVAHSRGGPGKKG
jgi:hypothetical protein